MESAAGWQQRKMQPSTLATEKNAAIDIDRGCICYNCRKPGHEARNCDKPNPRMQNLCATAQTLNVATVTKQDAEVEEETCPWKLQDIRAQNISS